MKTKIGFIILIFILWHGHANAQITRDSVQSEFKKISELLKIYPILKFTDNNTITSNQNDTIYFNISDLNKISSITNIPNRIFILRFILAHEFVHQLQFDEYKNNNKIFSNDDISRTLLEAQADILGGYIWFKLSVSQIFAINKLNSGESDKVALDLYEIMYNLGIRENLLSSHPSKKDRQLAFKLGISHASIQYFQSLSDNPQFYNKTSYTVQDVQRIVSEYNRINDYMNNETEMQWSYRQAKKIVNYDRKICTNLVLITDQTKRLKFYGTKSDPGSPYVVYNLEYKNIGNRSIKVEMEVYLAHIKRDSILKSNYYKKVNVNQYKYSLKPKESYTIKDSLRWDRCDFDNTNVTGLASDYMPRLVYPGSNEDALFSCSFVDDNSDNVYDADIKYLKLKKENDFYDFQINLLQLIDEYNLDSRRLETGIGTMKYFSNKVKCISYLSSIQFEEGTTTTVFYYPEDDKSEISIDFPIYNEWEIAKNKFEKLESYLDRILIEYKKEIYQGNKFNLIRDYILNNIVISITTASNDKNYQVFFSISTIDN